MKAFALKRITGASCAFVLLVVAGYAWQPLSTAAERTTSVTLYLDWVIDGYHAPFYVALKKGWYMENGLTAQIKPGRGSADAVKVVAAGRAEFGYADAGTMVKGVSEGAPVKMVAVFVRHTPAVFVCPKSAGVHTVKDMAGKSVGDAPQSATATLLPAVLAANGVQPSAVKFVAMNYSALTTCTRMRFFGSLPPGGRIRIVAAA